MGDQRLTRDELSWLLAQEARGAAKALRDGVSQLGPADATTAPPTSLPEVQVTLDALDGAIDAISHLQASPMQPSRRGRIDVASLLLQLAPNARIAIEPGAGTEVYGEEGELSRMLHVMLSQTSAPGEAIESIAPEIRVRREGELVRLGVALGPDQSATAELERRWLNRMAVRMGGRFELEGGDQALLLPAEGASARREVDELRKELEQARQLGETYARELAEVFAAGVPALSASPTSVSDDALFGSVRFDLLQGVSAAVVRRLRPLLEGMEADLEKVRAKWGDTFAPVQSFQQRLGATREVLGELQRVTISEARGAADELDVVSLIEEVVAQTERRASRHAVHLSLESETCPNLSVRRPILSLLVRSLLDHAIAATPRDGKVLVTVRPTEDGSVQVRVCDGGPGVPPHHHDDLLHHRLDPTSVGRPAGLTLLVANTASALLSAPLALGEGPVGGLSVTLKLPRAD